MGRLFGTDGVRGVANSELTPELAFSLGKAGAYVLSKGSEKKPTFLIGMDTRISGDMLENALSAGILAVGGDVIKAGVLPTPAIAHLVKHYDADAGIVISASHNPYEYNGIKFFNSEGFKLDDSIEEEIEDIILRQIDVNSHITHDQIGKCREADDNALDIYVKFLESTADFTLKGRKIVLDCANILKEQLEEMGLKVLLTRDGTEPEDENTAYNMYDEDGRITIANESKAKILISLHMNSNSASLSSGGVEVYAPSNCDLTLASLFADNIVELTNTNYSSLESYYKETDGVYVRNYTEYEILSSNRQAAEDGYEEYNLTTDTPYLYVIREIGGIITNAFVDGRNTYYGANKYVDSNIGIEGYLIELGYMSIEEDLNNVLENEATYMRAISESIKKLSIVSSFLISDSLTSISRANFALDTFFLFLKVFSPSNFIYFTSYNSVIFICPFTFCF